MQRARVTTIRLSKRKKSAMPKKIVDVGPGTLQTWNAQEPTHVKRLITLAAASALALAVACTKQTVTHPSDTVAAPETASTSSSAGSTASPMSVSITTPTAVTPSDGQAIKYADQPVTLTVRNSVGTGATALTYSFQVATDAAF